MLTEELFPQMQKYAEQDGLFNLFECLDNGPFSLYAVNHVTHKLLIQARKRPAGSHTLTILQGDPVDLEDEEEKFYCEDCKGEVTQE